MLSTAVQGYLRTLHTLHTVYFLFKKIDSVDKKREWDEIKKTDPGLADLLTAVNAEFGKPAALRVELVDGLVIERGTFGESRMIFDGKLRRCSYGKR